MKCISFSFYLKDITLLVVHNSLYNNILKIVKNKFITFVLKIF